MALTVIGQSISFSLPGTFVRMLSPDRDTRFTGERSGPMQRVLSPPVAKTSAANLIDPHELSQPTSKRCGRLMPVR